jgi:hypothetical protein
VFAQENGLNPADEDAFERFTAEEVLEMAAAKRGSLRVRDSWYGFCQSLGSFAQDDTTTTVEPILTFTLPPEELRAIRSGVADLINPPSEGYHDTIARGLVELGIDRAEADAYLRARYSLSSV